MMLKVPMNATGGVLGRREAVVGVEVHGTLALLLLSRFNTILRLRRFITQNYRNLCVEQSLSITVEVGLQQSHHSQ